jgi:putative ABC transport system ATP-binding protein
MLKLVGTTKQFEGGDVVTTALNNVSLEINDGEYIAVTGPSGCGKSTLMSILGLLDTPSVGDYWFNGEKVAGWSEAKLNERRRGSIGFIFQSFNLIEELSVQENVELALEYANVSGRERRDLITQTLNKLGVAHRALHRPSQLSGGQQQRVAIARALICKPTILLADEPTGNLDTVHGEQVMRILEEINAEGTTVVMVTHSLVHAKRASRTVGLLDGSIVDAAEAGASH